MTWYILLLALLTLLFVWAAAAERKVKAALHKTLSSHESLCLEYAKNPLLPIGSMKPMLRVLSETRASFEKGLLSTEKLEARLDAVRNFLVEIEAIAAPALLFSSREKLVREIRRLTTIVLPRLISGAQFTFPKPDYEMSRVIERAKDAIIASHGAKEHELSFVYRRCAIAHAELHNYRAFI